MPSNSGLRQMLYRQMHKRWSDFCVVHADLLQNEDEPALPTPLVQEFVANNIDWAKRKVQQRIDHIMWN